MLLVRIQQVKFQIIGVYWKVINKYVVLLKRNPSLLVTLEVIVNGVGMRVQLED